MQVQPKRIEFCVTDANFQYKILYWKPNSKITEYFRIFNASIIIIKCILCNEIYEKAFCTKIYERQFSLCAVKYTPKKRFAMKRFVKFLCCL